MKITYASNGQPVGDGVRVTRVSGDGSIFEVMVDGKLERYAALKFVAPEAPAPEPTPAPEPVPTPPTAPAPEPSYPVLPEGMRRPFEYRIGWGTKDEMILPTWVGGAGTLGNPHLIQFDLDDKSANLQAGYIGSTWNSGKLQINKPQRGKGRWQWITSSKRNVAVLAMFTYCGSSRTELDFEYVLKNGVRGWMLTVHMPLVAGGKTAIKTPLFVPMPDLTQPHLYEIELDEISCRFYIDGVLVGTITPADMPEGTLWKTDSKMETFCTIEKHGSWAGWDYTLGNADMKVYGIAVPPAPVVVEVPTGI